MYRTTLVLLSLLIFISITPGLAQELEAGFQDPPQEARTRAFWWWLSGNVAKEVITRDLEEMKAKGMGGALIFDAGSSAYRTVVEVPAGPLFGSPAWQELFLHALREADRLGLELGLNIQSGWNLGGPRVTHDEAAKQLTWSEMRIQGPAVVSEILPQPKAREGYYRDIALLAYRIKPAQAQSRPGIAQLVEKSAYRELGGSAPDCRPLLESGPVVPGEEDCAVADIIRLDEFVDIEGNLHWDVPEGEWQVFRFGYTLSGAHVSTASGEWQGLVVDYMSTPVLEAYWDRNVQPLLDAAGPLAGRSWQWLHTDSWECGGMNWTPGFEEHFKDLRGYDPLPYLPVIAGKIVENRDASNRFLADFRKSIGDCVADQHYKVFQEKAHRVGMKLHPESGGPHAGPIDGLKCLGRSDMPMGEFWSPSPHRPTPERRFFVKQAASAAHIYGGTRVAAEGFTTIGPHWEDSLWQHAKPAFDHEACAGLNLTYLHTFTCSPASMGLPGQEYFAGTHFNPNVTWWEQAGAVITYLNRCHYMLQQGQFVADVCYYFGDHVPNIAQRKEADPAGVLPGYDYDVINEEVLLERMTVEEGLLALPKGLRYQMLVLPDHRILSLPALRKIQELVEAGATVVGQPPVRTASLTGFPGSEDEFQTIVNTLWKEGHVGQGRVMVSSSGYAALIEAGIQPDVQISPELGEHAGAVHYIHRSTAQADIYFLANGKDTAIKFTAGFRVAGKQPELWDPVSGQIRPAALFQQRKNTTCIQLSLPPNGSVFVVFRDDIAPTVNGEMKSNYPTYTEVMTLNDPWRVSFDPAWGGPSSVVFETLTSWTIRPESGIRHYSGSATYQQSITLPKGALNEDSKLHLDLGEVREIASVRVNGQAIGVVWAPPFRVDITPALKPTGNNLLEIDVVNNWPNRLIGDAALPEKERRTKTNVTSFKPDSPLTPSGLLGPVRILSAQME